MHRLVLAIALAGCHHDQPKPEPTSGTVARTPADAAPGRRVVTDTSIQILDPITFEGQSAQFTPTSLPLLDAMADTLKGNPSILVVQVIAYGADQVAEFQQKLGEARAQAIVDALIQRGVAANRLRVDGEATPPGGRSTEPVFLILKRAPTP